MSVQPEMFKNFFANWPAAVTVITCQGTDGEPKGFTASSFGPLSLEPPLVMFALHRKAGVLPHFEAAERFGVSALRAGQEELSNQFAASRPDRFAGVAVRTGEHGTPLLEGAWGHMECRTRNRYDGGDHVIFVGEILTMSFTEEEPLVYHRRRYRRLTDGDA